jgi:SAM-dependent methyltransferase
VLATLRKHVDPAFSPRRVLDFGCGVGRLVVPFARVAADVVGMDVSEGMLAEARRNCDAAGLDNVMLVLSDDTLSAVEGEFDLVHSVIVLQHIEPRRGRDLFGQLVKRIAPGGAGAIQVTYAKRIHGARFGQPPGDGLLKRALRRVRAAVLPRAKADPEMQMNVYALNDLMFILQSAGVERTHAEFTDHGGELGVALYFTRCRADQRR